MNDSDIIAMMLDVTFDVSVNYMKEFSFQLIKENFRRLETHLKA